MPDEDRCSECGAIILKNDYVTESDGETDYWGAIVPMPEVVTGYVCPSCGHSGKFID